MLQNFRALALACLIGQVSAQSTHTIIAETNIVKESRHADKTTQKPLIKVPIQKPKSDSALLKVAQVHQVNQRYKLDSMDYKVQTATRLEATAG